MNSYTYSSKYGIIGTLLNECPGDAANIPGRDMTITGSHVRLLYFISSRLANGQEDFFMVKKIASQGELFPESSKHHSSYALRQRHALIAESVTKNSNGRPVDDLTGERFGYLTVISLLDERHNGNVVYLCECDCGVVIKQSRARLKTTYKPVTHCGCQGVGKSGKPRPGALSLGSKYAQLFSGGKNTSRLTLPKSLYANYRCKASERGYEFELTLNQFKALLEGDCHYCGSPPTQEHSRSDKVLRYNGIDRTDNDKGYTADNCVSCCGKCNRLKGTLSQGEFRQLIVSIYGHWV